MKSSIEQEIGPEHDKARQKTWIPEVLLSLGLAYVFIRSAASVLAFTYASVGKPGVLFLLLCSLLYFGFVSALARWESIQKYASVCWLHWINGMPGSLILGIIAMLAFAFLHDSQIVQGAYAIRVLLIVCAMSNFSSLLRKVFRQIAAKTGRSTIDGRRSVEIGSKTTDAVLVTMDGWKSMTSAARFLLASSYVFDSVLWTWLVIHYRYYDHSFFSESSWIIASLCAFLLSCWLHSAGAFIMSFRRVAQVPKVKDE